MPDALTLVAENAQVLALVAVVFVAGMAVPFRYGIERFRGFGRAMLSKLPYQPPPGMKAEEAMVEATSGEEGEKPEQR